MKHLYTTEQPCTQVVLVLHALHILLVAHVVYSLHHSLHNCQQQDQTKRIASLLLAINVCPHLLVLHPAAGTQHCTSCWCSRLHALVLLD